jgi:hypothetical protein
MESLNFERVGTLADFVKGTDELGRDPLNEADLDKQIYYKFKMKGKKEVQTAILSWPITKLLRSKRIALGNIFDYPMSRREDQEDIYSIHMEERELVWVKRNKLTVMKITKVEVTDEETIVL